MFRPLLAVGLVSAVFASPFAAVRRRDRPRKTSWKRQLPPGLSRRW